MPFRDLSEVLGSEPKVLPIRGRSVEFPGRISARVGALLLKVQGEIEAGRGDVDDIISSGLVTEADAIEIANSLLGEASEVLDEMGIVGEMRERVIETLTAWHLGGEEAAEATWEGKALNREGRRKAGRSSRTAGTASARSRAGAGASSASRKSTGGSGSARTSA